MVPVLDLRLFTQAEINELAGASSDAGDSRGCDDVVIPKIDRSVFNESAGSRKQTYSRLRLAPRKPPELCGTGSSPSTSPPVSGRGRGRASRRGVGPSSGKPFSLSTADADGVGGRENGQIVQFLRQLFAENGTEIPSASAAAPEDRSDDLGTILGNEKLDHGTMGSLDKNSIVMNSNGPAVDMIRPEKEDFFEEVLGRMTQGLVTEEQCLAFLWRLDGKWASSRKRRKIVSAAHFGAGFPKDWQLLLGLKRRNGNVFVHCRRYVSPIGEEFETFKEVSSYMFSSSGFQEARPAQALQNTAERPGNDQALGSNFLENMEILSQHSVSTTLPASSILYDAGTQTVNLGVGNPLKLESLCHRRCEKCNISFVDEVSKAQHLVAFHKRGRKRCSPGKPITEGVILRDSKFECQFCHKLFTERRQYNGHVGVHVRCNDITNCHSPFVLTEGMNSSELNEESSASRDDLQAYPVHKIDTFHNHVNDAVNGTANELAIICQENEYEGAEVSRVVGMHLAQDNEKKLKSSGDVRNTVQDECICFNESPRHVVTKVDGCPAIESEIMWNKSDNFEPGSSSLHNGDSPYISLSDAGIFNGERYSFYDPSNCRNGGQMQKEGTLALHGYAPIVVSLEFSGHNERGSDENGNRNSDEPETGVKSGADEHYETIVQTQIDQDKLCISKDRYPESANRSINVSDMVAMVYETDSLDLHCWPTKNDIVMDDLLLDQDSLFGMSGCNREGNRLCTQSATSQMQVDGISVDRTITFKDDPRNDRLGEEIDGIFSQALIPET
ncbi:methyl-CPG-binding domain 8 isoform X1 [Wolffia australiana]